MLQRQILQMSTFYHNIFILLFIVTITAQPQHNINLNCSRRFDTKLTMQTRDERDFGLETETETRVVSVSVSSFETKASKSQSQSHLLRPNGQSLSLSIKI